MSIEHLHTEYPHFFDHLETGIPRRSYQRSFVMCLDAEWYAEGGRNVVLSYQICTAGRTATRNIIKFVSKGQRLTLAEIVALGIDSVTPPDRHEPHHAENTIVLLVSHNTVAEWSVLADRDEPHITKRLALVRKSPITDGHPIKLMLDGCAPVDVFIFDTMLLSPASFMGLKKLSSLLGDEALEKIAVSQFYIEHMDVFLRDHPEQFIEYALRDSAITLRLFFVLQDCLNRLVGGDTFKLYRTLASAGVRGFLLKNDWFSDYRKIGRKEEFRKSYQLVRRSYYGGRNEGFLIGNTANHPETRNRIWIDIDLIGAYPSAMALVPKLDPDTQPDYIPFTYEITDLTVAHLIAENVSLEDITRAREALRTSPEAFDQVLREMSSRETAARIKKGARIRTAAKIRAAATKTDNRLVDKWYRAWRAAQQDGSADLEKYSVPGFARVRFRFPKETLFPCLPIRHEKYGLLYVLEGETTCSAIEIMLARDAGADIQALVSVELPIARNDRGDPIRFTMAHLATLAQERNRYKKKTGDNQAKVMEQLVKEFTNSFYGKFSQAINERNVYKPATGEMVPLGESTISEPCTAALVTALARATLSATLLGIERYNRGKPAAEQATVISATTDGLLIGLPARDGLTEVAEFYEEKNGVPQLKDEVKESLDPILTRLGCQELMTEINRFLPVRQMRASRREMSGSEEIFELKHLADQITSIKTRGQIGRLNSGHTSLLARFGHKPPLSEEITDPEEYKRVMDAGGVVRDTEDTKWFDRHLHRMQEGLEKIETYTFISLASFQKIIKSKGKMDLMKLTSKRRINFDFDWKRRMVWRDEEHTAVSPFTVPHQSVTSMLRHRDQMESIRRTGYRARPEKVLQRLQVQGRTIRYRDGEPVAVTRLFLRGVLQGKIPLNSKRTTYAALAEKLNQIWEERKLFRNYPKRWGVNDFKNNADAKWEPGCIPANPLLEELVADMAAAFDADAPAARAALFAIEEFHADQTALIEQVITAVTNAHRQGIEPFADLHRRGLLPDNRKVWETFHLRLTDEEIDASSARAFIPGQLPARDQKKLTRLFYSLSIPHKEAQACARSLAPSVPVMGKKRTNPGKRRCAEDFLLALLQADLSAGERDRVPWEKLLKYGLSRTRYYELKKSGNFRPNGVADTPMNRQQIQQMAKAVGRDPQPLLQALISH